MSQADLGQGYWNATAAAPDFPALQGDLQADVAVVGGGIVGVSTARALKDLGLTVALVEARRVGRDVTGKSTAKITAQHTLVYQSLVKTFGEDRTRLYAEAQQTGLRTILDQAKRFGIEADIEPRPAYIYAQDAEYVCEIETEVETAARLGLPAALAKGEIDLPFPVLAAIRYDGQAQFHPVKYVAGLAQTIPGGGCHVFEHSRVTDWSPTHVATEAGSIRARCVVMATHLPLGQVGLYYARAYPMAEPVVAAPIDRVPDGMYANRGQPSYSIRTHTGSDGRVYGIAAGSSFKPGHVDDELKAMAEIERWLREGFAAGPVEHRWVNHDYTPMDGAPFVGWSGGDDGYLVATGFNAWGITNGAAAGLLLADLAAGRDNPWLAIFDASRVKPVAGAKEFAKENLEVAAHLVGGYLASKPHDPEALAPGEAAVMKLDGRNVGAFRDEQGVLHTVSAVCTHMGCLLGWNETDRTWDCPCHGSRFGLDGEVLHGPATAPLGAGITR